MKKVVQQGVARKCDGMDDVSVRGLHCVSKMEPLCVTKETVLEARSEMERYIINPLPRCTAG